MNNPQCPLPSLIESFINQDRFPCVGAKIALNKSQITTLDFEDIRSDSHNQDILSDMLILSFLVENVRHNFLIKLFLIIQ